MKLTILLTVFLGLLGLALSGKECDHDHEVDLLFVLDSSRSISKEKFHVMIDFIKTLLHNEINLKKGYRIGLVQYSDDVTNSIPFHKFTAEQFEDAMNHLKYTGGETHLAEALSLVRTKALTKEFGYREKADHVVLILTDGRTTDEYKAEKEVEKLHKMGVNFMIVPIGKVVDKNQINELLQSQTEEIVDVKQWTGLQSKLDDLEKTNKKNCEPKHLKCPPGLKANVVFLLDASTSVGITNFNKMKDFVLKVFEAFQVIGKSGIEVGVITYSNNERTKVGFPLGSFDDLEGRREDLLASVRGLSFLKGATNVGNAFETAEQMFSKARAGAKNIAVLFVHQRSNDDVGAISRKLQAKGYMVLAVGIGLKGDGAAQLQNIASDPKELHVFVPTNFGQLSKYVDSLVGGMCGPEMQEGHEKDEH